MSRPFESYDDLEDVDERLGAADPGERRVAIIELGHSGDPAAVGHLERHGRRSRRRACASRSRWRSANSTARIRPPRWRSCWSIPSRRWRPPRPTAWPSSRTRHAPMRYCPWSSTRTLSSAWRALRALKELRRKDTLKPALEALRDSDAAVRVQAVGVIGFLQARGVDAGAHCGDRRFRCRTSGAAAVSALAFSQMKPAAESITRTLGDDDWMVREMAAETLGQQRQWHRSRWIN